VCCMRCAEKRRTGRSRFGELLQLGHAYSYSVRGFLLRRIATWGMGVVGGRGAVQIATCPQSTEQTPPFPLLSNGSGRGDRQLQPTELLLLRRQTHC